MPKVSMKFFLNGEEVTVEDPAPDLLLIDYLRSAEVGLTGAKKGCGEGGCGACTVILSRWDRALERVEHKAINSCLRPVCSLSGMSITTIEGTGHAPAPAPRLPSHALTFSRGAGRLTASAPRLRAALQAGAARREAASSGPSTGGDAGAPSRSGELNPVACRLAENNGSQCGYCSSGFVMNMTAFLAETPAPTKREIEQIFDGNLCRCTGYRPILTGMKTFAADWSAADEARRMKCLLPDGSPPRETPGTVAIPFPPAAARGPTRVHAARGGRRWESPTSLDELVELLRSADGRRVRLIQANTSYGVYPAEFLSAELLIDLRLIEELQGASVTYDFVRFGAATTFSELIELLDAANGAAGEATRLSAVLMMARRTAGTIVRNAATLAGNTMLVFAHVHQGEPFPSDTLTSLVAVDAQIEVLRVSSGVRASMSVHELLARVEVDPSLFRDLIILGYALPRGQLGEISLSQKVALREINSHAIINATTRLAFGEEGVVLDAALVFGGVGPAPWCATRTAKRMIGRKLTMAEIPALTAELAAETVAEMARVASRMTSLSYDGITDTYRLELVLSLFYKAVVNALLVRDPDAVPPADRSAGEMPWGRWPESSGVQHFETVAYRRPVGQPIIKTTALLQTSGELRYTHELPLPPRGEHAAFVQSKRALASFTFQLPTGSGAERCTPAELGAHLAAQHPDFIALITHEDIPPHGLNYQGMGLDQPLFAVSGVSYVGQSLALVIARSELAAIELAALVTETCVGYGPPSWAGAWAPRWYQPVLSLEQAIAMGSVFPDHPMEASYLSHIWKVTRPGSTLDWVAPRAPLDQDVSVRVAELDGVSCDVVTSAHQCGGQLHFYLETQACVVEPTDDGRMIVRSSSQSPMEMHQTAAMALGAQYNQVEVHIPPVGGGYGGKTEQARFVVGPAVVAASVRRRPIRLAVPRAADSAMIGKRHPYYGQVQVAVDRGERRNAAGALEIDPARRGVIRGLCAKLWGDGGAFYDCSYIVANCIQLRTDNAYRIANFQTELDVCRTNTAPNTAFRAFGDIQGKLILESAIDDAAVAMDLPADELREKNFYERGDITPFGQALSYCYMKEVWTYLKTRCDYAARRRAVDEYNAANRWRKRGIYLLPNKYGSGYNLVQLEQAAAVVSIYAGDGSIIINQGGVEMGQGLLTQAAQVASYVLNVPLDLITIQGADTSVIPNPTSTGASTGTPYAGEAVKRVCEVMRSRLTEFGYQQLKELGDARCRELGIDFWNYGVEGWAAEIAGREPRRSVWQNLVAQANAQRLSLVCAETTQMTGGTTPVPALQYKPRELQPNIPGIEIDERAQPGGAVDSFSGFTYSAACSEVEVDILTGEVKILRSDIVYDAGWSLNPALDIGQVEGGFLQGVGYVLSERLVFQRDGEERGRLNTTNTWRYKPPATTTVPLELNVTLFPRSLAADVPENPNNLFSAKEVGEPPLVLANSVFFAVKDAVRASRVERGLPALFRLDAPATVQEVRRACELENTPNTAPGKG